MLIWEAKMQKKYKLFLVLAISLLLFGCGKETKEKDKKTTENNIKSSEIGTFISYGDNLYYWKLNKDSRSDEATLSEPKDLLEATNELVKVDNKGKESVVLKDKGSEELVISNDKIYTSYSNDEYENDRTIYLVDLDGQNKKEIGKGFMSSIVDNKYIYGNTEQFSSDIFMIDTESGEYEIIKEKAQVIGDNKGIVYYADVSSNSSLTIGTIENNEDKGNFISINDSDFKGDPTVISLEKIVLNENNIEIYAGYRDGSANLIQELIKFTYDYEGKNLKKEEIADGDSRYDLTNDTVYLGPTDIFYQVNNKEEKLISLKDLESKYELKNNEETAIRIYKGNIVNDNVYFILDYSLHDSASDIGWRYAYKREKTLYFRYDIKNKKLTKMLEF